VNIPSGASLSQKVGLQKTGNATAADRGVIAWAFGIGRRGRHARPRQEKVRKKLKRSPGKRNTEIVTLSEDDGARRKIKRSGTAVGRGVVVSSGHWREV